MSALSNIKEVSKMLDLPEDLVKKMIEKALIAGYKKEFGKEYDNVVIGSSEDLKKLEVFSIKKVVEEVKDPVLEISLEEARKYAKDININETINIPVDITKFGRPALDVIRNTLIQEKIEIEKDKIASIIRAKIGDIVTGKITNIRNRNIFVIINVGSEKIDGILPYDKQLPDEYRNYRVGDNINALVEDVISSEENDQKAKRKGVTFSDSKALLSRVSPEFVKKLFENNIPEVQKGLVEIKSIARIPGERSKVAVYSKFQGVDPVGACIGVGGSRILSVSREISGEKIDIVLWSDDLLSFARNVFGRDAVEYVEDRGSEVIIRIYEDRFDVIGKKSINIKLFEKLIEKNVKVIAVDVSSEKKEIFIDKDEIGEDTYVDYLPIDKSVIVKLKEKDIKTIGKLVENLPNLKSLGFLPKEISHIVEIVNEYIEVEVEEE